MASPISANLEPRTSADSNSPPLSEAAQRFLGNVFIYGTGSRPKTPDDFVPIRKAFYQASIEESEKAKELYIDHFERAARRNPGPSGPGQASYLLGCGKALAARYRSGESPSLEEGVLQKQTIAGVPVLSAIPRHFSPAQKGKVIVYMHGGSFTLGSSEHLFQVFSQVADETGLRAIAIDYRLAPEHRFPAGLNDCEAVYTALLQEYKPQDIALLGDSAGGTFCLATALTAKRKNLGLPGAIALFSSLTNSQKGESYDKNEDPHIDYENSIRPCLEAYVKKGSDFDHPCLSILNADLTGLPPLIVQTGTRDALQSDSIRLEATQSKGVDATLFSMAGIWHGVVERMGIPEADKARSQIAQFIKEKLNIS